MPTATIPGHLIKVDDDVQFIVASVWEGGTPTAKPLMIKIAHLISAAPCLLAALKTALPVLDDAEQDAREQAAGARASMRICRNRADMVALQTSAQRWEHVADCYKGDADAARAAIAKAEGKAAKRKPSTRNKAR